MDDEAPAPKPAMFGRYRLEGLIGRGGMGEVFRAYDTVRDRIVALKRLPAVFADDPTFQARFRSEAALAARLREPHIVPIHDYGEIDGQLYIDMRLVDGPDLATMLSHEGPLSAERAVDIVSQVAAALDAAHAAGLVHRDVKPDNILFADSPGFPRGADFIYVTDFGIARATDTGTSGSLTTTGTTVGSFDYIAPERFMSGPGDRRADIYSLGCVLYETLTASRPFPVYGLPGIINAHLNTPPPTLRARRPDLSTGLDAVIARAMAKDPDHRYPTAGALAVAAREVLRGPSTSPADADPPDALPATDAARTDQGRDAEGAATLIGASSEEQARPAARGRIRVPVAAMVALVFAATLAVTAGVLLSTRPGSSPGASGNRRPVPAAPSPPTVPLAGPMQIWLVSGPGDPPPSPTLTSGAADFFRRHEVVPVVDAISGDRFPAEFQKAIAGHDAPEIVAGPNYLPFDSFTQQRGVLTAVTGPLEALIRYDGFAFLVNAAPRFDAASQLARSEESCPEPTMALRSTPATAVDDVAIAATAALLRGDGPTLSPLLAASSIQSTTGLVPSAVESVAVCHHAGGERSGLVYLSATYSSDKSVGQMNVAVVVVREGSLWKALDVSYDPLLLNFASVGTPQSPFDDAAESGMLLRAIDGAAGAAPLSADLSLSLVGPSDGVAPAPPAGEDFGSFTWSVRGDLDQISVPFCEFAFQESTPRLALADRDGDGYSVNAGQLWTAPGEVLPWRAWVLRKDGSIITSEVRRFTQ